MAVLPENVVRGLLVTATSFTDTHCAPSSLIPTHVSNHDSHPHSHRLGPVRRVITCLFSSPFPPFNFRRWRRSHLSRLSRSHPRRLHLHGLHQTHPRQILRSLVRPLQSPRPNMGGSGPPYSPHPPQRAAGWLGLHGVRRGVQQVRRAQLPDYQVHPAGRDGRGAAGRRAGQERRRGGA